MFNAYQALATPARDEYKDLTEDAINFRISRLEKVVGPVPDYCNDIGVMWPVIVKTKININWHTSGPLKSQATCSYASGNIRNQYTHGNVLRAAAILYLKLMKWVESHQPNREEAQ